MPLKHLGDRLVVLVLGAPEPKEVEVCDIGCQRQYGGLPLRQIVGEPGHPRGVPDHLFEFFAQFLPFVVLSGLALPYVEGASLGNWVVFLSPIKETALISLSQSPEQIWVIPAGILILLSPWR